MKVIIDGFKNEETAQTFIDWYCEQGEQTIGIWLDCRRDEGIDVPRSLNCYRTEMQEIKDDAYKMYIGER